MRNKLNYMVPVVLISAMLLIGCSAGSSSDATATTQNTVATAADQTDTVAATTVSTKTVTSSTSVIAVNGEFTANDLDVGYEDSMATHITLNNNDIEVSGEGATASGNVVTIQTKGIYVITGTLENGQIIVDAGEEDKVQLILNGVSVNCSDNAAIYVKKADKVFLTLNKDCVNTLTDGSDYIQSDENQVDGVIFSTADLTINGEGTLNIQGNYKQGIVSKDDLVITGGIFHIEAVNDAINGKDCVKINNGTFNISTSTGNAIQSKNGEDNTTGYVYIAGGTFTVSCCKEGIEGTAIIIEGGTIDITSTDDGLNAAIAETTDTNTDTNMFENDTNCYISISGGSLRVNASGDGIDSNGSIYISGGEIYVSGPTANDNAGLDYNGIADINGGTLIVAGSSGMAQSLSDTSSQYSILYNLDSACTAGTEIKLSDAKGNVVVSYTPDKSYQSVVISSPTLENGATYTLTCGSQTAEITLSAMVTSNGQSSMGMQGGPNQGGGPRGN